MSNLKPITMPTVYTVQDAATLAVFLRYAHYLRVEVLNVEPATGDRFNYYGFRVKLGNAVEVTNKTDLTEFVGDQDMMRVWWSSISQHVGRTA